MLHAEPAHPTSRARTRLSAYYRQQPPPLLLLLLLSMMAVPAGYYEVAELHSSTGNSDNDCLQQLVVACSRSSGWTTRAAADQCSTSASSSRPSLFQGYPHQSDTHAARELLMLRLLICGRHDSGASVNVACARQCFRVVDRLRIGCRAPVLVTARAPERMPIRRPRQSTVFI